MALRDRPTYSAAREEGSRMRSRCAEAEPRTAMIASRMSCNSSASPAPRDSYSRRKGPWRSQEGIASGGVTA